MNGLKQNDKISNLCDISLLKGSPKNPENSKAIRDGHSLLREGLTASQGVEKGAYTSD